MTSGRRLLAIGLGGLGGLGIALSISPAGVVDAIDPSVRTLRNLGFGGAVAFGIAQVRDTGNVSPRRLIVEWSGAARSRPSNGRVDAISPSVWRSAKPKTARSVSAVVIANAE
jgi:hypothetical protein